VPILCYHGVSLEDEHQWAGGIYVSPECFERRLQWFRELKLNLLTIREAFVRIRTGTLPERPLVITFDDGHADFITKVLPLIRKYEVPITLYQTTYYSLESRPIFRLICNYMLWTKRGTVAKLPAPLPGETDPIDLRTDAARASLLAKLDRYAKEQRLSGAGKNELAAALATALGIDYAMMVASRKLQIMRPEEIAQVASHVDLQLHTHRHRTPRTRGLFHREIDDNRKVLREITGRDDFIHFCYPSGVVRPELPGWLAERGIQTATTADYGLWHRQTNPLLIPRYLDKQTATDHEIEGWVTGLASLFPNRRWAPRDPEE
jgi:peptidoglycan/xylan/chitin deacetylase (PgdA/CDA1 family)